MPFSIRTECNLQIKEVLDPLNEAEIKTLCSLLNKLREKSKNKNMDRVSVGCFIIDRLTDNHNEELSVGVSIVANKLANKPFLGDREMLKGTLESIMHAVSFSENYDHD